MKYSLLSDHLQIRKRFLLRFTLAYPDFCRIRRERMRRWPERYRDQFTESYYERIPYSDRLIPAFRPLSFVDALAQLRSWARPARFLTNGPDSLCHDHTILGNQTLYCALADPRELADRLEFEWFEEYRLFEEMMHLPDAIFPSELYVFDEQMSRCLIFTHETDETELPETRICLTFRAGGL